LQVSVPLKSLQEPFKKINQGHFKYPFYFKYQFPSSPFKTHQRKQIRDISSIRFPQVPSRTIKENKSGTFQVSVSLKSLQDPDKNHSRKTHTRTTQERPIQDPFKIQKKCCGRAYGMVK